MPISEQTSIFLIILSPAVAMYGAVCREPCGQSHSTMPGGLAKARTVIVGTMKKESVTVGRPWAVHVALESERIGFVRQKYEELLKLVDGWKDASYGTNQDELG